MSTITVKPTELEDHTGSVVTFEFPSGTKVTGKLNSVYVYSNSIDVYMDIRSENDQTLTFEVYETQYEEVTITVEAPPLPTALGSIIRVLEATELASEFKNTILVLQVDSSLKPTWTTLDGHYNVPTRAILKFKELKFEED